MTVIEGQRKAVVKVLQAVRNLAEAEGVALEYVYLTNLPTRLSVRLTFTGPWDLLRSLAVEIDDTARTVCTDLEILHTDAARDYLLANTNRL